MRAAGNHDAETAVTALLDKGADVNAKTAKGETALMAAVRYGSPHVVSELLRRGAVPNEKTRHSKTALALAQERWTAHAGDEGSQEEAAEIVHMLKQAGAQ